MSGLAGQAIGLETQSPTPIGGPAALDAESKGSMENFVGFGLGATSYDPSPVDFDAADDTVTSAADGSTRVAPEYTDSQLSWGGSTPSDGILFDTARGDSFVGNFVATPSNGAVITATSIKLDSDTPVNVDILLQNLGSDVSQCFDDWYIEVDYDLTGNFIGADVPGVLHGYKNQVSSWSGVMDRGHGGLGGGTAYPSKWLQAGSVGYGDGGKTIGSGISCNGKLSLVEGTINWFLTYGTDPGIDQSLTLTSSPGTNEIPRMFNKIGLNFQGGHAVVNRIKVCANHPNAKYALIGDSITQGRYAAAYPDGFGMLLRADYPENVLICGGASALIEDWTEEKIAVVADMKPKYAIVMLGTNNAVSAESAEAMKSKFDSLVALVIAKGIIPVVVGIPPNSYYTTPDFNSLLAGSYPRFIDCYTPLWSGSEATMAGVYDHGDGIHPNSAGHAVIASTIQAAITSNGWT